MLAERLEALQSVIEGAVSLALDYVHQRSTLKLGVKGPRDYVTDADRHLEQWITNELSKAFPQDNVVGEEFGGQFGEAFWLVDPIDGTSNFLSGLPFWGISIAYVERGMPVLGAIALPELDMQAIAATHGCLKFQGQIAGVSLPAPRVFAVGRNTVWDKHERQEAEGRAEAHGYNIVCLGSSSVSMIYTAIGRLAGFAEARIGFWDCAAGTVLCRAAGIPVLLNPGSEGANAAVCCAPKILLDNMSSRISSLREISGVQNP